LCLLLGMSLFRSQPPLRIAIMTFEPTGISRSAENDIAELLTERLSNHRELKLHVIGPTTTREFDGQPRALSSLVETHSIDYMINGRFLDLDQDLLLAEIIRASDAAHVWTARLDWRKDQVQAADTVANGFFQTVIGHKRAPKG